MATKIQLTMEQLEKEISSKDQPLKPLKPLNLSPGKGMKTSTSSMIHYIKQQMDNHPESVVVTQVGSFFEIYLHQAVEYGPRLNLKIARKSHESPFPDIPFINMAGFPVYQLDRYLKILVHDLRKTVVLLEQSPELSSEMTEEQKRPISRIVTPGTLVGDSFLDSSRSNFLAAIEFTNAHLEGPPSESSPVSIAWSDYSVGSLFYQSTTLGDLMGDLARIKPNEILLDSVIRKYHIEDGEWFEDLAELKRYFFNYRRFPSKDDFKYYADLFDESKAEMVYAADKVDDKELSAITAILSYIRDNWPETPIKLDPPKQRFVQDTLRMDSRSQEALELFQASSSDSVKGSLFSVIRRTLTPSGTRLLSEWLAYPLLDLEEIRKRQNFVEHMLQNPMLANDLIAIIRPLDDTERTLQRIKLKKVDPLDLHTMSSCIDVFEQVYQRLGEFKDPIFSTWIEEFKTNLRSLRILSGRIKKTLDIGSIIARRHDEEELLALSGVVKSSKKGVKKDGTETRAILLPDASATLVKLYQSRNEFDSEKKKLEVQFQQACKGLPVKVSLRWSPMHLYHVNIKLESKGGPSIEPYVQSVKIDGAILNQTKKTLCIQNGEWTRLGVMKDKFQDQVRDEEERVIQDIKSKILSSSKKLTTCSNIVDQLDAFLSMVSLAREQNLVKPELDTGNSLDISGGYHLAVAGSLFREGNEFKENDCQLNSRHHRSVTVITGPNMGGKSTYLRQIALICILAQIGSFVPASSAKIGLVDRIFCRVGSGDDLFRGRSTFMVEMLETGHILKHATDRSLAILDEVGRGTSTSDGLSLAYATLGYLSKKNKCRTLFATHFGQELKNLMDINSQASNYNFYHTEALVSGNSIRFNHKLKPGISISSHGLDVARLAGFPADALNIARDISESLVTPPEDVKVNGPYNIDPSFV